MAATLNWAWLSALRAAAHRDLRARDEFDLYILGRLNDLEVAQMSGAHMLGSEQWLRAMAERVENVEDAIGRLSGGLHRIERKLMSTQADVDALSAELTQEQSDLNTAVSGIQSEIAALQAQHPGVDVSALKAQVDAMKTAVSAAAALVPASPAPAPSPDPNPAPAPVTPPAGP